MSSAKAIANARNGRKSNGAKTAAGKLTIARANTTNGIRSNLPVLEGIEDLAECERFHQGFVAAWQPVGIHEEQCVEHLAHCYWRLRRAKRYESEATIAEMLAAVHCEDAEVQSQIEALLGRTVELEETSQEFFTSENGELATDESGEWTSPAWWRQILSGPDELKLSPAQTEGLFSYVVERILEREDGEEDDGPSPDLKLPAGVITLGALRAQFEELTSLCQPDDPSPFEILEQKYGLVVYEEGRRKQARAQACRLISRNLLLPPERHAFLLNERRQVLSEIRHHMNTLERLQAKRLGEPVLAPVSVDVNVTGQVHGEGR